MRALSMGFLVAMLLAVTTPAGVAQDYPTRPVRILVPYAVGGGSDTAGRLVMDPLSKQLGVSVYIDNRGGAGGLTGTEAFLAGEPDGYTLLMAAVGPFAIIPAGKSVRYDVATDFAPLGQIWLSSQALAVRKDLNVKTLADFIALAKANPGKLTVGSAGFGTLTHLALELLKREAGIEVTHGPFRSGGALLPALIGGQIDAGFADTTTFAPQVETGTVIGIAAAGTRRSPALPNLVTMVESGFPGVIAESWNGLVVNARTPAPVIARLQAAVSAVQKDAGFQESLKKQGLTSGPPGVEAFQTLLKTEAGRWRTIVNAAGIKFD